MAEKAIYIQNLKTFQLNVSRMEYLGNTLSYSRPRMQKHYGISNNFIADFYTEIPKKYTARGLYYQRAPFEQALLISCRKGIAMMYFVDLRKSSPTYLENNCFRLSAGTDARDYIYIPRGVAYGFVTLTDDTCIDFKADNYLSLEYHEIFNLADPFFSFTVPYPDPNGAKERLSVLMAEDKLVISSIDKYAQWVSQFLAENDSVLEGVLENNDEFRMDVKLEEEEEVEVII